jgi:hypothetical protein
MTVLALLLLALLLLALLLLALLLLALLLLAGHDHRGPPAGPAGRRVRGPRTEAGTPELSASVRRLEAEVDRRLAGWEGGDPRPGLILGRRAGRRGVRRPTWTPGRRRPGGTRWSRPG